MLDETIPAEGNTAVPPSGEIDQTTGDVDADLGGAQGNEAAPAADVNKPAGQKQVPYDRFKEVIDERNKYRELLGVIDTDKQPKPTQTEVRPKLDSQDYVNPDDVESAVRPIIDKTIDRKLDRMNRQLDLDRAIAQHPDFFKYSELIKSKIEETPTMSWGDAYKLAKFETVEAEAREAGRKEAIAAIEQKKQAIVETANKTKTKNPLSSDHVDPLAKGPDGKFLYSREELESILPKS